MITQSHRALAAMLGASVFFEPTEARDKFSTGIEALIQKIFYPQTLIGDEIKTQEK